MPSASPNKYSGFAVAFAAVLLPFLAAAVPDADYVDLRHIEPVRDGNATAGKDKATTCIACHGENGISPASIFPNLRGQTVEYLYWALIDFGRGTRPMSPMTALVAGLSDQDMRDLAAFYAQAVSQPASQTVPATAPAETPDAALLAQGERLYLQGDPTRGVPPCQGCHGVDGRGHPLVTQSGVGSSSGTRTSYRTYPALRAQHADYLVTKLTEYHEDKLTDSTNDFIMAGVARHLDDESIRAIAAWLSAQ